MPLFSSIFISGSGSSQLLHVWLIERWHGAPPEVIHPIFCIPKPTPKEELADPKKGQRWRVLVDGLDCSKHLKEAKEWELVNTLLAYGRTRLDPSNRTG